MDKWFFNQARKGNMYRSSNTAATVSTALNVTHTGFVLSNPVASGKWLVIRSFSYLSTTTTTTRFLGLCTSLEVDDTNVVHSVACVVHNAIDRGSNVANGVGKTDQGATLPNTPVNLMPVLWHGSTAAGEMGAMSTTVYFNGSLILPPGTYCGTHHITAAVTGYGAFDWAEVDPF